MKPHDWHRRWQKFFAGLGGGGIAYLLYDAFTTARAAGSVNGTPAEPTGQTRTVVDTTNALSISGNAVQIASVNTNDDPRLYYNPPSLVRTAGQMVIAEYTPANATQRWAIGFSTSNLITGVSFAVYFISGSQVGVLDAGLSKGVGSFVAGTFYKICIIQRATGFFAFIKGGTFTFWTLIWVGLANSTTPLFQVSGGVAVSAFGGVEDNVRIPQTLYLPPPTAYDTFTRANGALGSTEQVSPDALAIAALVWNFTTGKWAIVTNVAVGTPTQGADVIINGAFAADTDWSKGAGWTIGSGTANASAASSNLLALVAPLTVGVWYQVTWTLSAFAAGTVRARCGSNTLLPTHAANGTYTEIQRADTTANFLFVGAGFTGSLDNVSAKALTLADLFASVLVSTADVIVDVAVTLVGATGALQAGLVLNLDSTSSPANFILVYLDGYGNCVVDECVAGIYTSKQTTAITYSAGAVLRVVRNGTELRVFYNNAAVGVAQTMTANVNKNHGLFSTSPSNSLDGFTVWTRGTSGEYEGALNAL